MASFSVWHQIVCFSYQRTQKTKIQLTSQTFCFPQKLWDTGLSLAPGGWVGGWAAWAGSVCRRALGSWNWWQSCLPKDEWHQCFAVQHSWSFCRSTFSGKSLPSKNLRPVLADSGRSHILMSCVWTELCTLSSLENVLHAHCIKEGECAEGKHPTHLPRWITELYILQSISLVFLISVWLFVQAPCVSPSPVPRVLHRIVLNSHLQTRDVLCGWWELLADICSFVNYLWVVV